jgi:hypothetical protein
MTGNLEGYRQVSYRVLYFIPGCYLKKRLLGNNCRNGRPIEMAFNVSEILGLDFSGDMVRF